MSSRLLCKPLTLEMSRVVGRTSQTSTLDVSVGLLDVVEAVFDRRPSTASMHGFHLPIENVLPDYTEVCLAEILHTMTTIAASCLRLSDELSVITSFLSRLCSEM